MDYTTIDVGINNELAPVSTTGSNYYSIIVVNNTAEGLLTVNLPLGVDTNGNGTPDFFDISQAIDIITAGTYNVPGWGSGSVSARWVRYAGERLGGAHFTFNNRNPVLTFSHFCEILEFTGEVAYTPGPNAVTGSVTLTNSAEPIFTWAGPVAFQKASTNKYNLLTLQDNFWTNQWDETLEVWEQDFTRNSARPTNYTGILEFLDGDKLTFEPDYWWWRLIITDTADTDGDGIPNFSDDLPGLLPRRPNVALTRTPTNLLLRISGDVGHLHQVQEASAINSLSWPTIASVTLTNDPQVVALPLPTGSARFWRVAAQ
jgi:hypothetical protein